MAQGTDDPVQQARVAMFRQQLQQLGWTDRNLQIDTRWSAGTVDNIRDGHVHGALRAGDDPGRAVLDRECQSHVVKGLHVLDASFMPTAGASNPSLTLIANAYRICQRVQKDVL